MDEFEFKVKKLISITELKKRYIIHCFNIIRNKSTLAKLLGVSFKTIVKYTPKLELIKKQLKDEISKKDEKKIKKERTSAQQMGYRSVTPKERDDWYNRDRF